MSEEVRVLKEILDNVDLDNYTIDDDECYLSAYARKCLKKVLDQLQQKENIIKEVREYIKFLKEHYEELRTSPVEDSYFIDDMLRQMFIQSIENYLVCIEDILDKENK